ncbi:hsp72-like protein [Apiospora marii]|uniref:Hsp72-like protein n=1 Tax=Apiospora marii TaxID=335849 RepID=A0ABR1SBP5_9PEZI
MASVGVGIDIGTANTRVAVYRNDKYEIIPDEDGSPSMPSYVSFGEKQRFFGAAAKRQANRNPENTVFNVLRLLGRDFLDVGLQDDLNYLPFRVVGDDKPLIQVRYLGQEVRFTPEQVLAMILSKAKQNAEAYLHQTVMEVQISVPADFGIRKYDAVRDAAAIAGLEVLELLPSPTCASYVLGLGRPEKDPYSYVIADAGAGGFSAAVITCDEDVHEVASVVGDTGLGGEDFLKNLVYHFVDRIREMWNKDITKNRKAIQRLRSACEQAICDLSSAQSTKIDLEALFEGRNFYHHFTRQDFEVFSAQLIKRMRETLDQALDEAKVTKSEVKYVFPLGGCSRMPQVRKLLSDCFNGSDLDRFLDTEEAQVCGLAVGASIKTGDQSNSRASEPLLLSALPKSLGVGTWRTGTEVGSVNKILLKNSMMINRKESVFSLSLTDYDPAVSYTPKQGKTKPAGGELSPGMRVMDFYEGEGSFASNNERVGTLYLDPILPPPGPEVISLRVKLDSRSGFRVKAKVTALETGSAHSGKKNSISMFLGDRLPDERLQQLITDEAKYRRADDAEAQRVAQRVDLDRQISSLSEMLSSDYAAVVERKPNLRETINSMRTWLEDNENAPLAEYRTKLQILTSIQWDLQDRGTQSHTSQSTADPAPPYQKDPDATPRTPSGSRLLRKEIREMISWLDQVRVDFDQKKKRLEETLEGLADSDSDPTEDPEPKDQSPTHKRPPSMDAAERFASHFDGSKKAYTAADWDMISAYLRTKSEKKHSENPKLYTVLRLIGELQVFDQFVERGISDDLIPRLSYESLPPSINMEIARKFMGRRSVVMDV